jgi:arsenate reductase (thioredoxin)
MKTEIMLRSLHALSDPSRLRIVQFLAGCCCSRAPIRDDGSVEGPTAGEVCCHITGADRITSTISHHLHELESAGIVHLEKRGKATLCSLNGSAIEHLAEDLRALAAGNHGEASCCSETSVLFVCVHNAGRSQMAEALTNELAKKMGLRVRAESAGTVVGKTLNPVAVQVMEEIGISMEGHSPKLLTQTMADQAQKVISMGCGVDVEACPAKFILTEDWGLDDPAGQPIERVREIRDAIQSRVESMLSQMETLC